jgi:ornithine decarboxylase
MSRQRSTSFADIDEIQASGILTDVLRENNVYLGGSSMGRGLRKAANYYLKNRLAKMPKPSHFNLPGAAALNADAEIIPLEDSFYVVDIGVLVSQVYQWRKYFPRVEPFYAVKCNPDPVFLRTLAILGANFDCASRNEIRLVLEASEDLPRKPEIIYANPCKARGHLLEAVCRGVRLVTFDNAVEVQKCAAVSKKIELILRIVTDDRGSQCRLSSKFGAPRNKWRPLLSVAKKAGLEVVGVSFHVGSGCRDATRYEMALKDAREIFDMAEREFGFKMTILDIGGGFPGETHSMWNPVMLDPEEEELDDKKEGTPGVVEEEEVKADDNEAHFMFFTEIALQVGPVIDELFPPESGVRIISEPGRYFVAASSTLFCSVISARSNELDEKFEPEAISDKETSMALHEMPREEESQLLMKRARSIRGRSLCKDEANDEVLEAIVDELAEYSQLFARQNLAQQEADVYNDPVDLFKGGWDTASDLLGPPDDDQIKNRHHTVEGMNYPLVAGDDEEDQGALITLAAAGEAAVNGVVMQAVADSAPLQDDFAYYINDGVYGAFNNIMFDHASVRPRVLKGMHVRITERSEDGFVTLESSGSDDDSQDGSQNLFASTVFGPTCDSIDVITRSVLLPKLRVGDWLYFQNMGAYTMAASSSFNGFTPSEKFYVCSVQPEHFEGLIAGPDADEDPEEKKDS